VKALMLAKKAFKTFLSFAWT